MSLQSESQNGHLAADPAFGQARKKGEWGISGLGLGFGCLLVALCLYLLSDFRVERLFQGLHGANQPVAGTLLRAKNDVRRRIADDVRWLPILDLSPLYMEDRIFTGEDSTAELELSDGSLIKLAPESLIALRRTDDSELLVIRKGTVFGTLGSRRSLLVSHDGNITQLTSTSPQAELSIEAEENRPLRIRSPRDLIRITPLTELKLLPKTRDLPKAVPSLVPSRPSASLPIGPELMEPADGAVFHLGELEVKPSRTVELSANSVGLIIPLKWKNGGGAPLYEWEMSQDALMQTKSYKRKVKGNSTDTPRLLEGSYFWRVRSMRNVAGRAPAWSGTFQFKIESTAVALAQAPTPASSPEGQHGVLVMGKTEINLAWSKRKGAKAYRVEISLSKDFNRESLVLTRRTTATQLRETIRRAGKYFWRVQAILETGEVTVFSAAEKIEIGIRTPKIPKSVQDFQGAFAPRPRRPLYSAVSWWLNLVLPSAVASQADGPVLEWEEIPEARSYLLEISEKPSFQKPILRQPLSTNRFQWVNYRPGIYYWRVSAVDETGQSTPPSAPAQVRIRIAAPVLERQRDLEEETSNAATVNAPFSEVELHWSQDPAYHLYEIQLSSDGEFRNMQRFLTEVNHFRIRPPRPGSYHWRVRKISADQSPISPLSAPSEFTVARTYRPAPAASSNASSNALGNPRCWSFLAAIGASSIHYTDGGVSDFSEFALFAALQLKRGWENSPWAIEARIEGTPFSISRNLPATARILGGDLRASLRSPLPDLAWSVEIAAGVSYLTFYTDPNSFGFTHLAGPELVLTLERRLARSSSLSVQGKFVAPAHELSLYPLSDHQISAGATYSHALPDSRALLISLNLNWATALLRRGLTSTSSSSLEVGYEF